MTNASTSRDGHTLFLEKSTSSYTPRTSCAYRVWPICCKHGATHRRCCALSVVTIFTLAPCVRHEFVKTSNYSKMGCPSFWFRRTSFLPEIPLLSVKIQNPSILYPRPLEAPYFHRILSRFLVSDIYHRRHGRSPPPSQVSLLALAL